MDDELARGVLQQAIARRQPRAGLIHHTDRGGQYASTCYRSMLRRAGFRQSMSRADDCYDNAFMESCFGTIKTELESVYSLGPGDAGCKKPRTRRRSLPCRRRVRAPPGTR